MDFTERRIVVVGAGSGIGRCIAQAAAQAGASLVLVGRTRAALEETAGALPRTEVRVADASNEAEVETMFQAIGDFDHLISTASQGASGTLTAIHPEAIHRSFEAKLWAPINLVKHGAKHISADGSFTFFSGFRASRPTKGTSITSLVNGGLEAFARAMAVELAPVRVNVISPGIVDSGAFWGRVDAPARERMFADFAERAPGRRVGTPEEQASAALFAAAQPFMTGAVIPVDGGALLM